LRLSEGKNRGEGEQLGVMEFVNAASVIRQCVVILLMKSLPLKMRIVARRWIIRGPGNSGLGIFQQEDVHDGTQFILFAFPLLIHSKGAG